MQKTVAEFLRTEAGGGVLVVLAALLAVVLANSPWAGSYFELLKRPLGVDLGFWNVDFTFQYWVKDGLMAIFFYVVGLELKRELTVGELSDPRAVVLPVASAIGGALVPVAIYLVVAGGMDPRGWPVPVATDIAFALAALALLAPAADPRVRIFLLTLAVVDDLIAIILIAVLFTSNLALAPLSLALGLLAATWMVQKRVALPAPLYPLVALATWMLAVQAGVHSSVMAVAAAMIVPPRDAGRGETLLGVLEHAIHPVSSFFVLPLFAFCAAGVSLADFRVSQLAAGVPAGITLGLALGKPLGVGLAYVAVARLIRAPGTLGRSDLLTVGCLCGIGFTMSLFISGLAFAGDAVAESSARIGVLAGSLIALALSVLSVRLRPPSPQGRPALNGPADPRA